MMRSLGRCGNTLLFVTHRDQRLVRYRLKSRRWQVIGPYGWEPFRPELYR